MNLGFGGGSESSSQSASTNVWPEFEEAFKQMVSNLPSAYKRSMGLQDRVEQGSQFTDEYNRDLATQAKNAASNLSQGGAFNESNPLYNSLVNSMNQSSSNPSNMGQMYESIVGGQGNTYIDPLVDSMRQGGMERLNMMRGGNEQNAASMGQSGSSRHAMADAMAMRGINQDMNLAENQLRAGAYDKDLAMKMGIAKQADTNILSSQQNMLDTLLGQNNSMSQGVADLNSSQNLGFGSMTDDVFAQRALWDNMLNYANTIGDPTVIGQSSSNSGGWNIFGNGGIV